MTTQRKWLIVVGVVAAAAGAQALGVPAGTLLLFGAFLLCPAAMYFGMSGMQGGCRQTGKCNHDENTTQSSTSSEAGRKTPGYERQKAA